MDNSASNVERSSLNFGLSRAILLFLIICNTHGMKESYTKYKHYQNDYVSKRHFLAAVPEKTGKQEGEKEQLRTTTYVHVPNTRDHFFIDTKSINMHDRHRQNVRLSSNMGGIGSGRKVAKATSVNKKSTHTSKFASNLATLGFTNGSKMGTTTTSQNSERTAPEDSDATQDKTDDNDSNAGGTRVKFDTIPGLDCVKKVDNAPVEKPMIEQVNQEVSHDKITKTHKIQIQYRTKTEKKEVDVIEKVKCLMARLFQYDKTIQLLPFYSTNKSNPITTSKDVPNDMESFQIYVPDASVHPRTKTLRMSFKITSERRLWQIKMINGVKNYLSQYNIWLDETFLVTLDNVKVGGLILSHPQFTRRDTATRDINRRINENEELKTPIQLSPTNIWNTSGNKISTKVLAVECSKGHAQLVRNRLFTKLLNVPDSMQYSNTRYFKFVPFTATGTITDKVIRSGIYLQNKYLIQTTAITIVNINRLQWVVPNTIDTFQALVLSAKIPDTESTIFTTIEMGMLDNKAHLLTTKSAWEVASKWVDNLITKMSAASAPSEFWLERTGFSKPPERLDRPVISDAQLAYANYLEQSIVQLVGDGCEESGVKTAPARRSYSRVVYGGHTTTSDSKNTKKTTSTAVSTITSGSGKMENENLQKTMKQTMKNIQNESRNIQEEAKKMQEESKKGQRDMRKALLEEMKEIRQEHKSRYLKVEESVDVFEHMLKELHASNKEKSQEMASYEKRLAQIGSSTAHTAEKVDQLSRAMNEKVDKLHQTMKAFINVMADTINTSNQTDEDIARQKQNLGELTSLLEAETKDLESPMDLDNEDDSSINTMTTLPGTQEALRGKAEKK